jgi:UDP-N-acetylglucosamine/UDP-N-acetylgalactosamine 4-epimerase
MILVTGGAGFIGSNLVEAFLRNGHRIRVLDNLSTGKVENLEAVALGALAHVSGPTAESHPVVPLGERAEFLWGDITDLNTCREACRGISHVFHQAALGSVQRSVEDPLRTHQVNATGTLNILEAARDSGVSRVMYASSSSVYGDISLTPDEVSPKKETLSPNPQSPYAVSKLSGEHYCRVFSRVYGLETVVLRYFNVFGPRQDPASVYAAVIPKFIKALRNGSPPIIYGDGGQSRDFTFVENVVQANLKAMERPGISGEVLNIACGERNSLQDLVMMLNEISGQRILPRYEHPRQGDVRHSLADISLAQKYLAYEVKAGLKEGLNITWKWFQGKGGNPKPA